MSVDPRSYNQPNRKTLSEVDVQGLGDAVLSLTREVWVLTDRIAVMEAVLAKRGIDISAEIEAFQPDEKMKAALDARGRKLVATISKALAGISENDA